MNLLLSFGNVWLRRLAIFGVSTFSIAYGAIIWDGLSDNLHPADVAVVLGSQVLNNNKPSPLLEARLHHAADLYHQGDCKVILVSGGREREGYDEPAVMSAYLQSQGVPLPVIFQDDDGYNTWLTAQNSAQFMLDHHLQSVLIVTSYFHITRSRMAFKKFGMHPIYTSHAPFWTARDFYFSLPREVVGCVVYYFRNANERHLNSRLAATFISLRKNQPAKGWA